MISVTDVFTEATGGAYGPFESRCDPFHVSHAGDLGMLFELLRSRPPTVRGRANTSRFAPQARFLVVMETEWCSLGEVRS